MAQTRREWIQANVLSAEGVAEQLGVAPSSVYVYRRRQRDGIAGYQDFPAPVLEHGRCLLWLRGDIQQWMRARSKR